MYYFTLLYIYFGNEISALHILIKSLFGKGLNICNLSGFKECASSFLEKKGKNGANKAIRQGNGEYVNIGKLILLRIDTHLHIHQGLQ